MCAFCFVRNRLELYNILVNCLHRQPGVSLKGREGRGGCQLFIGNVGVSHTISPKVILVIMNASYLVKNPADVIIWCCSNIKVTWDVGIRLHYRVSVKYSATTIFDKYSSDLSGIWIRKMFLCGRQWLPATSKPKEKYQVFRLLNQIQIYLSNTFIIT